MTTVDPFPTTSTTRWKDTPNRAVEAAGTTFAYRRLGAASGVPVVLLNHWGATLDNFDAAIVDGLASTRPILALDYRGVGGSGGKPPLTVAEMARDAVAVIRTLGFEEVDLIGFSLGGFVAQQIVLDHPALIRKVILAGTGPAGGEGIARVGPVSWPLMLKGLLTLTDPKTYLFFTSTANGRRAAKAFLDRLKLRTVDRDKPATLGLLLGQLKAIKAWGLQPPQDLSKVTQPVLVANGDHDIMVPTANSRDLARRLPNAELVIYEDAGHGGIFQNHAAFVGKALMFLDA
ncbi:pimeloyl-ACP methyl ester carboxylesterase [Ancylobacter sp. 3268]|uniref:alpha/beta fold hydrolase n=1 Tax=Ancylobacter sp. 3268 TaxID=2817752 RepID=UPI00285E4DCC|nr:alpha/beta hydrolase [Ancylobacter sp. 3268]MDR6955919.1 pimeloyl-ACP methyl ester carboxylesterase [Ancylobacter sp. 3268]